MNFYNTIFITTGILCLICLIIEGTLNEKLQYNSGRYIEKLQENYNSESKEFFVVVSEGAIYIAIGIGFVVFVPMLSEIGSMCILVTFILTWTGDLLKMVYAHPRPFWEYSDIVAMSCANDFGAPSGHAVTVGGIILYFYAVFFNRFKVISTTVTALLLALIALDRNYLGVHFYFQVILGYTIAAFLVCGLIGQTSWKLLRELPEKKKILIIAEGIFLLLSLIAVLVYFVRNPEFKNEWKTNFSSQCNKEFTSGTALFNSLLESTSIWIPGGFILGLHCLQVKSVKNWKYYVSSYLILIIFFIIDLMIETYSASLSFTAQYFIYTIIRFIAGFCIAFGIPSLLSLCFKPIPDSIASNSQLKILDANHPNLE